MTNKQPIFLAEYSPEQKCCHIDTLDRCVEVNLQSIIAGQPASFIPLGYFNDHDGARKFLESIFDKLLISVDLHGEIGNG